LTPFHSSGPSNMISASPMWGMRSGGTKSRSTDRWIKGTVRSVAGALERAGGRGRPSRSRRTPSGS
jgi:hypothetical protein